MTDKTIDETELLRDDFVKCVYQSNLKTQEAFKTQSEVIAGLYERVSHLEHQLINNSKIKSVRTNVKKSTFQSHSDDIDNDDSDVELIPEIFEDQEEVSCDSQFDEYLVDSSTISFDEQQWNRENDRYVREQTEVSETTNTSTENRTNRKTDSLLEKANTFETSTSKSTIRAFCNLPVVCSQRKETSNQNASIEAHNVPFTSQRESQKTIQRNELYNTVVKYQNQPLQHDANVDTVTSQCSEVVIKFSEHEEVEETQAMVAPQDMSHQHVNVNTLTSHCNEHLVNLSEHEEMKKTRTIENSKSTVVRSEEHVSVSNTVHDVVEVRNRVFVERRSGESNSSSEFHHSVVDCNKDSNKNINGIWFGPGTTVLTENHDEDDTGPSMFANFAEDFQKHLKLSIQPMIDARSTKS